MIKENNINYYFIQCCINGFCLSVSYDNKQTEMISEITDDLDEIVTLYNNLQKLLKKENKNFFPTKSFLVALINLDNVKEVNIEKESGIFPQKYVKITFNNDFSIHTHYSRSKKSILNFYNQLCSKINTTNNNLKIFEK